MDGSVDGADVARDGRFGNAIGRNLPWADGRRNSPILPSLADDDERKEAAMSTIVRNKTTLKSRIIRQSFLGWLVLCWRGTSNPCDDF